mmetsp:Transcript_62210/g.190015  ORF Transcript_62210/g.190015 Transcript_62210/m.190015 type:complete len:212 (-) Transcript_62210:642-1277(-)
MAVLAQRLRGVAESDPGHRLSRPADSEFALPRLGVGVPGVAGLLVVGGVGGRVVRARRQGPGVLQPRSAGHPPGCRPGRRVGHAAGLGRALRRLQRHGPGVRPRRVAHLGALGPRGVRARHQAEHRGVAGHRRVLRAAVRPPLHPQRRAVSLRHIDDHGRRDWVVFSHDGHHGLEVRRGRSVVTHHIRRFRCGLQLARGSRVPLLPGVPRQ